MLTFLPLIGLFANIVLQAVTSAGIISPATTALINGLIAGVVPLIGNLTSGNSKVQDVLAVLAGLSSIIDTLKADTKLPADKLAIIQTYDAEIQAAIAAYVQAGKGLDLTAYTPITPVQ